MTSQHATGIAAATADSGLPRSPGSAFLKKSIVDGFSDPRDRPERITVPFGHVRRSEIWPVMHELPVEQAGAHEAIARVHARRHTSNALLSNRPFTQGQSMRAPPFSLSAAPWRV